MLVDSTVLLHAIGSDPIRARRCRAYLRGLWDGNGRGYVSTEALQEVVHHRLRITGSRETATADARDYGRFLIVLDFDQEVLEASFELIARTGVRGRDAVHAATALAYGIPTIASSDAAFDGIPGLRRIDPLVE